MATFPTKTTGQLTSADNWNTLQDYVDDEKLVPLDTADVTSGTEATLTLTVPTGVRVARIVGRFRTDAAQLRHNVTIRPNGDSTSGAYRDWTVVWAMNSNTPTASFPAAGSGWRVEGGAAGDNATSGRFGTIEATILPCHTSGNEKQIMWSAGVDVDGSSANARLGEGRGRRTSMGVITTIVLSPQASGSFVAGTRVELWPG